MPALERQIALRGPKFFRSAEGALQFVHHMDGSTRIGPRDLNPEDQAVYAEAWEAFEAEEAGEAARAEAVRKQFTPLISFETPEDHEPAEPLKAKGSKAPV